MKNLDYYLNILRHYKKEKSEICGITKIGIFGSIARNEQTDNSDVDVCVEMKRPDLFSLVHIKDDLQKRLGRSVDIVRLRENMNPFLRKEINKDGVYA